VPRRFATCPSNGPRSSSPLGGSSRRKASRGVRTNPQYVQKKDPLVPVAAGGHWCRISRPGQFRERKRSEPRQTWSIFHLNHLAAKICYSYSKNDVPDARRRHRLSPRLLEPGTVCSDRRGLQRRPGPHRSATPSDPGAACAAAPKSGIHPGPSTLTSSAARNLPGTRLGKKTKWLTSAATKGHPPVKYEERACVNLVNSKIGLADLDDTDRITFGSLVYLSDSLGVRCRKSIAGKTRPGSGHRTRDPEAASCGQPVRAKIGPCQKSGCGGSSSRRGFATVRYDVGTIAA